MAYIRIKKPVEGMTEVILDDSRGATRMRRYSGPIARAALTAVLDEFGTAYHEARAELKAVRQARRR